MKELLKDHKYLLKEEFNENIELWLIMQVTKTCYNVKLESGKTVWVSKQRVGNRYEILEDLGSTMIKIETKSEKEIMDFIKKEIERRERKEKDEFPWGKKPSPWEFPLKKYTWTNDRENEMNVTYQC